MRFNGSDNVIINYDYSVLTDDDESISVKTEQQLIDCIHKAMSNFTNYIDGISEIILDKKNVEFKKLIRIKFVPFKHTELSHIHPYKFYETKVHGYSNFLVLEEPIGECAIFENLRCMAKYVISNMDNINNIYVDKKPTDYSLFDVLIINPGSDEEIEIEAESEGLI